MRNCRNLPFAAQYQKQKPLGLKSKRWRSWPALAILPTVINGWLLIPAWPGNAAKALPLAGFNASQTSSQGGGSSTLAPTKLAPQRALLVATFGYLGGQGGLFLNKANGAAVDTVMISFKNADQCEFAANQLKEKWRNDVVNSICLPLPDDAQVHH